MTDNILNQLDGLIKRASENKSRALAKEAQDGNISSKLDNAEDGTSEATTGEHAADQMQAQRETYPENAADVDANDNPAGESVDMSSDEATAAAPSGQEGAQGAELEPEKQADNGPTLGDTPKPNGWDSGAFKQAAADLRKTAQELEKAAEELLSPLDRFLVKSARASQDEQLQKQAMAMPDDELANAAADTLMSQIEAGEIGDEEAGQILQEALASGAISEEDLAAAAQEMEAGGDLQQAGPEPMADEQMLEAKLAAADIGPDDPRYMEKLAAFYGPEINSGYLFGLKLAEELAKEAEGDDKDKGKPEDKFEENKRDLKDDGKLNDSVKQAEEVADVDVEVEKPEGETDGNGDDTPTEGSGEEPENGGEEQENGEEEGGEEAQETEEVVEEPPLPEGMDMIAPTSPGEEAALQAVQQELGVDDAALQQLMAAPIPPEAKIALSKTASAMQTGGLDYSTRVRTTILNKVAALQS